MTNFFDEVREVAKEQYKTETELDQFMEGFISKTAGILDYLGTERPHTALTPPDAKGNQHGVLVESYFGNSIAKGIGESAGRSVVGMATTGAMVGIGKMVGAVQSHNLYNVFRKTLNEAVQMNKVLKGADKEKVLSYATTIYKFAPHVATDPNLLSQILANAIHGEGVDPMTIKTLTELESRYMETKVFRPKDYV